MAEFSLKEHLARAGKVAAVLRKHGADIADLADDAPKLIAIAGELRDAFKEGDVQASTAAAAQTAPQAAPPPPKITAQQAAAHVERHGLTAAQRVVFDKAGGAGTG